MDHDELNDVFAGLDKEEKDMAMHDEHLEKMTKRILSGVGGEGEEQGDGDGDDGSDGMNDEALLRELAEGDDDPELLAALNESANSDDELKALEDEDGLSDLDDVPDDGDGSHDAAPAGDEQPHAAKPAKASASADGQASMPPSSGQIGGWMDDEVASRPAKPPAAAGSAASGSMLNVDSLKDRILEAQHKAVDLKRAGKQAEAIQALRVLKVLQARVKEIESTGPSVSSQLPKALLDDIEKNFKEIDSLAASAGPSSVSAPPAAPASAKSNPSPAAATASAAPAAARAAGANPSNPGAAPTVSVSHFIRSRLDEYNRAAVGYKKAGNLEAAKTLVLHIRDIKAMLAQQTEAESLKDPSKSVSIASLPPALTPNAPVPPYAPARPGSGSKASLIRQNSAQKLAASKQKRAAQAGSRSPPPQAKLSTQPSERQRVEKEVPSRAGPAARPVSAANPAAPALPPRPVIVAPSPSGPTDAVRDGLEYDALLHKLQEQIAKMEAAARAAIAAKDKDVAMEYVRLKKVTEKDRDLVLAAQRHGYKAPISAIEDRTINQEVKNDHLNDQTLELELKGVNGVSDKSVCASFVLEHPSTEEAQKVKSPNFTANQEFKWIHRFSLNPRVRKQDVALQRFARQKLVVTVNAPGFFRDKVIGTAEIKLADFLKRCEVNVKAPIMEDRKKSAGEIHVVLRLQTPLAGRDIRGISVPFVAVQQFFGPQESAAPPASAPVPAAAAAAQPPPAQSVPVAEPVAAVSVSAPEQPAAPAVVPSAVDDGDVGDEPAPPPQEVKVAAPRKHSGAAPAAAPAADALPPGITMSHINNPFDVSLIVSSDVFDSEIAATQQQIAACKVAIRSAAGEAKEKEMEKLDNLEERLRALEVQNQILIIKVQNGKLTFDDYLQRLRDAIARDTQLAIALGKRNNKVAAAGVLKRVKTMQAELKNAEENADQVE